MERFARTLLCLILLCSLATVPVKVQAKDNSGMHASVKDYILPQYRGRDNHLQFVVFGTDASNKGALVHLTQAKIDILTNSAGTLEDANIFLPHTGKRLDMIPECYPVSASDSVRDVFWAVPKQKTVRAWIFSDRAVYDKSSEILRSDDPVHFRARELDADGVGFDAYHEKKFIHIRSHVKVYIRINVLQKKSEEKNKQEK